MLNSLTLTSPLPPSFKHGGRKTKTKQPNPITRHSMADSLLVGLDPNEQPLHSQPGLAWW